MAISKKSDSPKPLNDNAERGYGKPPKENQFKKGMSGNPSGRPKKDKVFKSMSCILREKLLREIEVTVNGKPRKMLMLEAVIAKQEMSALQGNVQSAKLLLALGEKHIPGNLSIQELMEGRSVFEWTPEQEARFTEAMILEGHKPDNDGGEPDNEGVVSDKKPIL